MRKLGLLLLACAVLGAQDLPPSTVAPVAPAAPPVLENTGKPMVASFHCTEEDIRLAGLGCSEQDPCPVYLELAAVDANSPKAQNAEVPEAAWEVGFSDLA